MVRLWTILFFLSARALAVPSGEGGEYSLTLGTGTSQSIQVEQLASAAVANAKIARARAIPPSTLVVTALRPGITTLRVWNDDGVEEAYSVEVISADLWRSDRSKGKGVVRVALEFIEIDSTLSQTLGIRWPDILRFSGSVIAGGDMATSGLNYSAAFQSAQGFVSQLVQDGWAKILARPELYVRLGEQGKFHSGGEFPVQTSSQNVGGIQQRVEWKKFGMSVEVRPQSIDTLTIQSDVHLEVSEPSTPSGASGIPSLIRRQIDTKISSEDGETVILSGLVRETESRREEGLPILRDIPLLGSLLFSSTEKKREGTELLMALTVSYSTRATNRQRRAEVQRRYEGAGR